VERSLTDVRLLRSPAYCTASRGVVPFLCELCLRTASVPRFAREPVTVSSHLKTNQGFLQLGRTDRSPSCPQDPMVGVVGRLSLRRACVSQMPRLQWYALTAQRGTKVAPRV